MIPQEFLALYTDDLLSSFSLTTATGVAELVDQAYSHDQIPRFLSKEDDPPKTYWHQITSVVRQIETDDGIVIVDDTIEENPSTDEPEIVCWYADPTQNRNVKGINLLTSVYYRDVRTGQAMTILLAWEVGAKTAPVDADFVILDVRTPAEFQSGKLADAVNLDYYAPNFRAEMAKLAKDKTYFVYCRTGNRSSQTLRLMQELNFRQVYHLTGRIVGWIQEKLPVMP